MKTATLGRIAALACLTLLSGCVRVTLAWVPLTPKGPEAEPSVLAALGDHPVVSSREDWEARRDDVRDILSREIYGIMPTSWETEIREHTIFDDNAYEGLGTFEEIEVAATPHFEGMDEPVTDTFRMSLTVPTKPGPHPIVIIESFCAPWNALPHRKAYVPDGVEPRESEGLERYIWGRYICRPPIEDILEEGYAVAVLNVGGILPDREEEGLAALRRFVGPDADEQTRWGSIAGWSWLFSTMVDVVSEDERIDASRIIAWGHSRYGKAALHAGAFDDRIAAVIAHQSGTGGASLNRQKIGESVGAITKGYPHWFAPTYATYAGREDELTLDQHHLVALMAPRPVLLGNARRDVWSDPNGAIKAARGAAPVYALYSDEAMSLDRLDQYNPQQSLSFWMRPGTHGVVEEDWPAFLAFLHAHVGD